MSYLFLLLTLLTYFHSIATQLECFISYESH